MYRFISLPRMNSQSKNGQAKNSQAKNSQAKNLQFIAVLLGGLLAGPIMAKPVWTLQSSVQRMMQIAPEMKMADAMVSVSQSQLQQADAWPNPQVEIRADEKLGLDDGSGGYDLTQFVISQPLPIGRLAPQLKSAEAHLQMTQSQQHQQQLLLEYKTALLFHELQFNAAKLKLSEQRLKFAKEWQQQGRKKSSTDLLVRYLSPLEKKRLDILREVARQEFASAEGEYNEVASTFQALLGLDGHDPLQLVEMKLIERPLVLQELKQLQDVHPQLKAGQQALMVAQSDVEVARRSRFADPSVNLFWERDNFNSGRENYTGISLNLEVPLWNQNKSSVDKARSEAIRSSAELQLTQRDLSSQLQQSYLHLGHILDQARDYRKKLLKPARQLFELTRKSFAAGEQNLLGLIDANHAYFDAQAGYQKLLADAGMELAKLRLTAGLSVIDTTKTLSQDSTPIQTGAIQ